MRASAKRLSLSKAVEGILMQTPRQAGKDQMKFEDKVERGESQRGKSGRGMKLRGQNISPSSISESPSRTSEHSSLLPPRSRYFVSTCRMYVLGRSRRELAKRCIQSPQKLRVAPFKWLSAFPKSDTYTFLASPSAAWNLRC